MEAASGTVGKSGRGATERCFPQRKRTGFRSSIHRGDAAGPLAAQVPGAGGLEARRGEKQEKIVEPCGRVRGRAREAARRRARFHKFLEGR